jgi:hypothetical protein
MELRLRLESIFWWNAMDVPGTVATAGVLVKGDRLVVEGIIVEADGQWLIRDSAEGTAQYGEMIARDVADSCRDLARKRLSLAGEPVPGRAAS